MDDAKQYLDKARIGIDQKDITVFISNITLAKDKSQSNDPIDNEVKYTYLKGLYHFNQFKKALDYIEECLPQLQDQARKNKVLIYKGLIQGKLGNFGQAIDIFEDLISEESEIKFMAINNLMWTYLYLFITESDQKYLARAIDLGEEHTEQPSSLSNNKYAKNLLDNLGTAYWYKGEYHQSLKWFNAALTYQNEDPKLLNNIAATYIQLNMFKKAEDYLHKAELMADKTDNLFEKGQTYMISADLYEQNQDYSMAVEYYQVALDNFTSAHAFIEANKCFDNIIRLTAMIDRETIGVFTKHYKDKMQFNFGKRLELKTDTSKEVRL